MKATRLLLSTALASLVLSAAWAHSDHGHAATGSAVPAPTQDRAVGKPGDAKKASRTITIETLDSMRFGPADITARQGETIRFVVVNKGVLPHELVIGTKDELKAHADEMRKNPHGAHDAHGGHGSQGAVQVNPGEKKEIVWEFTRTGTVDFGCLLPGHYEAGMVGKIKVTKS